MGGRGEHGLKKPEQLQTAGILWVSGIYFPLSVHDTTAFSHLQSSLELVGTISDAFSLGLT